MLRVTGSSTCNAEVSRTCDKQTSTTTNVVDVNWVVIVINKLRPPPTLLNVDDTAYSSASAPSWTRTTRG